MAASLPVDVRTQPAACPFRTATGLPCPFCGGVRAFELATHGDPGFASFNGWWVLVAAAVLVLSAASLIAPALTRGATLPWERIGAVLWRTPSQALMTIGAVGAGGWIWALAERASILG